MSDQIEHKHTREIECPHCNCHYTESVEVEPGEEIKSWFECGRCGKLFYCERNISITYSTFKDTGRSL